jgi:hypothetical protein
MQTTVQTPAPEAAAQAADAAAAAKAAQEAAVTADVAATAQSSYLAARAARNELRDQLDALVGQRHSLLRELEDHDVAGPATAGMQQRIVQLDGRIAQLDVAVSNADATVAAAAAIPGAVVDAPHIRGGGPPEELFFIAPALLTFLMMPIMFAFARRIWRRSAAPAQQQQLPSDLSERLARLEQMGETTALEVERIGEGQRFVTRLMTEKAGRELGEGAAVHSER